MSPRPHALATIALHRIVVLVGIVLLPLAVLARKAGIVLPMHRALDKIDRIESDTREDGRAAD